MESQATPESFLLNLSDENLASRLCQEICVLLEWRSYEAGLLPKVRCEEPISLQQAVKCCLQMKKG